MRHVRLPSEPHRMPNSAVCLLLALSFTATAAAVGVLAAAEEETSESAEICEHDRSAECTWSTSHVCIDARCMCNPQWGHTGAECDQKSWSSWAVVVVLALVILYSIHVLHAAAKKGVSTSTNSRSGFTELAHIFFMVNREYDSGCAAMRAVIGTAMVESAGHAWKILTAAAVISDSQSRYWEETIFFPLAEGSYMLPSAIVISVWMDVANLSLSRAKARKKLRTKKKALEISAFSYVLFLVVVCEFGYLYLAMVMNLVALALGMCACGSGSAKLCSTLRKSGGSSAEIATKVFQVSRSMGMCFYAMFVGNGMLLASHTRKSNPANLALVGLTISSVSKCLLNKAIFEYACDSARAKRDRTATAKPGKRYSGARNRRNSAKPAADVALSVSTLQHSIQRKNAHAAQQLNAAIAPVEENPRENESDNVNRGSVTEAPCLPVLGPLDQPCDETKSELETTSPLPSPHRQELDMEASKDVAPDNETGCNHAPDALPQLVRLGRRISSSLCIPMALSQQSGEWGSNASVSQSFHSRPSMPSVADTSDRERMTSQD